jgi:hypothetical protein
MFCMAKAPLHQGVPGLYVAMLFSQRAMQNPADFSDRSAIGYGRILL